MRKSNESSLKEVIDQLLDTYRLRDKISEITVTRMWETMMGAAIAKRTREVIIKNKILHIRITSAPLKHELLYQREEIRVRMNKELGNDYLKEVVIE